MNICLSQIRQTGFYHFGQTTVFLLVTLSHAGCLPCVNCRLPIARRLTYGSLSKINIRGSSPWSVGLFGGRPQLVVRLVSTLDLIKHHMVLCHSRFQGQGFRSVLGALSLRGRRTCAFH